MKVANITSKENIKRLHYAMYRYPQGTLILNPHCLKLVVLGNHYVSYDNEILAYCHNIKNNSIGKYVLYNKLNWSKILGTVRIEKKENYEIY
jgi:hypothetical protein